MSAGVTGVSCLLRGSRFQARTAFSFKTEADSPFCGLYVLVLKSQSRHLT